MKRIILCLSLFAFFGSQAQQINPVPDYVFSNKMSVGRNAVTDTAAYFSIGPRYGAIRGMMPPMVTDTASMSATKRNGLLIFSIQKNKYLYWDSVGSKWAEMAGTAGSAITGSGVAGYMPEFTTATNIDTTRLYHSNGRFAIGSTTTTNGVFNVIGGTTYLEGNLSFGAADRTISNISNNVLAFGTNNTERLRIFANGRVGVNTTTDAGYQFDVNGTLRSVNGANFATTSGTVGVGITNVTGGTKFEVAGNISIKSGADAFLQTTDANNIILRADQQGGTAGKGVYTQYWNGSGWQNAWYINNVASNFSNLILQPDGGEVYIRRTYDAGSYALQVTGNTYVTGNGIFAATGGNIGIGLENPTERLSILSGAGVVAGISLRGNNNATTGEFFIGHWSDNTGYLINRSNMPLVFATNNTQRGRISETGEWLINSDGADSGDYKLQVTGNILTTESLTTGTPTGGTKKPWKLGEVATISPTSPNRTIRVEIDGTVYYIHAKTTND